MVAIFLTQVKYFVMTLFYLMFNNSNYLLEMLCQSRIDQFGPACDLIV